MNDLAQLNACQLAHLLRTGELSNLELVSQTIARIEASEPELNALTNRGFEQALERAKEPLSKGFFGGVPWLMKDLIDTPDLPRSNGAHVTLEQNNKQVSDFVKASNKGGLNLLAMTNTPEFGCSVHTNTIRFGETKNPWSDTSPAGSSGGSAAAVAAGYVPMAHATDGGGSIRLPSSYCGVFGFKPSRGINYCTEFSGEHDLIKHHHVISRSVRDSAAFLDLTTPTAEPNFCELNEAPFQPLRIAVDYGGLLRLVPEARQIKALESTCKLLSNMGHDLVEWQQWPISGQDYFQNFENVMLSRIPLLIGLIEQATGKDFVENKWLSPYITSMAPSALILNGDELQRASDYFAQTNITINQAMKNAKVDVILSPVQPLDYLAPDRISPYSQFEGVKDDLNQFLNYTALANGTGAPAMSVPLYWPNEGHPLGSHFYATPSDDALLMKLAFDLEQAQPWKHQYLKLAN
jgi:amidase